MCIRDRIFILPGISPETIAGISMVNATPLSAEEYSHIFTVFIIIQGFFAGLVTGKMSEGSIQAGFKHSLILVFTGYVVFTLAAQFLPQIKLI